MKRAQKRNAVLEQKFWFRKHVFGFSDKIHLFEQGCRLIDKNEVSMGRAESARSVRSQPSSYSTTTINDESGTHQTNVEEEFELMSLDEIMNGKVHIILIKRKNLETKKE